MNEDQDPSEEFPETEPSEQEPEVAAESDESTDERRKRGCLSSILLFPFVTYGPWVRRRTRGAFGVLMFIILFPLWIYMWATPVVWWFSYNLSREDTARVYKPQENQVVGLAYVDALIGCYESQMSHWMYNDRIAPTILLDNPQNFQLGVREGLLYGTRVLRDNLSRQRSTDTIDEDVKKAHESFSYNADKWLIPSTESQFKDGIAALRRYRERLEKGKAPFHPRADNLAELITQFNSVTGGANARLLNCVPDLRDRYSEETLGDPTSSGEEKLSATVAWSEVDDHFYYARGVAYVFREVMSAVNYDFREILEQRNAQELANSIVVDLLDKAQFEPLYVARGRNESLWANHPSKLLALLSGVRERCRSLHTMVAIDVR